MSANGYHPSPSPELLQKVSWASDPMVQQRILVEVLRERSKQDEKWGEQHHPDLPPDCAGAAAIAHGMKAADWKRRNDERVQSGTLAWDGILLEEAFEAAEETNEEKKLKELVQVAAVAVCWIEDILSRRATQPTQLALFEVTS